jgi:hypothetical protein
MGKEYVPHQDLRTQKVKHALVEAVELARAV